MPSRPNKKSNKGNSPGFKKRPSGDNKRSAVKRGKPKDIYAQASAAFKRSSNGNRRMPTLFLKDEETAPCIIFNKPKLIKTHSVKQNGRWVTVICAGKKCRLCAIGHRASPAMAWPAIDKRKRVWKDRDGKKHTVKDASVIVMIRRRSFPKFKKLAESGKLFSRIIEITRYGESTDTSYDPEVGRKLKPEEKNMKVDFDYELVMSPPSSSEQKVLANSMSRRDDDDDFDSDFDDEDDYDTDDDEDGVEDDDDEDVGDDEDDDDDLDDDEDADDDDDDSDDFDDDDFDDDGDDDYDDDYDDEED